MFQIFGLELIHDIQREDGRLSSDQSDDVVIALNNEEKTVCNIKTGVNDFLDYLGILVTIVIPTILGNCFSVQSLVLNNATNLKLGLLQAPAGLWSDDREII